VFYSAVVGSVSDGSGSLCLHANKNALTTKNITETTITDNTTEIIETIHKNPTTITTKHNTSNKTT
jgi:hypothetical protein